MSEAWREGDVRIDDATIHYYRRGSGPPVVLAHGALDDGRCWTRVAEALASATLCAAFRAPVLLVCGGNEARGQIVPPSVAARAGEVCPTLESVCLQQAGHNARRQAYDAYVAAVRAFLRRN